MPALASPRVNVESNAFEEEYSKVNELSLESSDEMPSIGWITGRLENVQSSGYQITTTITPFPQTAGAVSAWFDEGVSATNLPSISGTALPYQIFFATVPQNPPLFVHTVNAGRFTLRAKYGLALGVERDESGSLLCVEEKRLGISAFARSRSELESLVKEQIAVLWNQYALEDSARLSKKALELKERLLDFWKIDVHAAQK